jgi:hypothetical protein
MDQFVDGHDVHPVCTTERRRRSRRYLRGEIAGVDNATQAANLETPTGQV